jgi:hypothetical protein
VRFWLSAVYWNFQQDNSWKVLTFLRLSCGKACLTTVQFAKSFANYPAKWHAFRRIIRKKSKLSSDFNAEKPALTQNNLRKDMPFRSIINRRFWLSANYAPERHVFPWYDSRKVAESSDFPLIIHEKSNFLHEYLREFTKKYKTIFDVHQGPIRCWLMKKREQKRSCYSPFKPLGLCFFLNKNNGTVKNLKSKSSSYKILYTGFFF